MEDFERGHRVTPGTFGKKPGPSFAELTLASVETSESLWWHVSVESWVPARVQLAWLWVKRYVFRRRLE